MPRLSKHKLQVYKANQVSVNVRKTAKREEQIQTINKALLQMNNNELELICQDIIQLTSNKKVIQTTHCQKLIETIKQLPDDQAKSAIHMLTMIKYSKEAQKEYLKICAIACKPQVLDSQSLKANIQAMLMKNKYEYTTQFINIAIQVLQIGQISFQNTVQATQMILGLEII
ncbi:13077_t:CDS:2 [Gigaspora margarita]|uniref:13077_t:CDS:1 n=1 Tax=Gigaspora margarita TaxID=4874 RepID=A0ABN7W172_GIGMA|nr:13077_t:CDS:2 [Gigaspora margarita]